MVENWCHDAFAQHDDIDAIVDGIQDDVSMDNKDSKVLESDDMEFDFGLDEVEIDLDLSLNSHPHGRKLMKEKCLKRNKAVEFQLD